MAKLLFQRCQDQTIDKLPDIGDEADRLEIPLLVIIAKVIGLNPLVQNGDRLRKNILSEPPGIRRESSFVDPEDYKTNVAENEFLGLNLAASLGLSN